MLYVEVKTEYCPPIEIVADFPSATTFIEVRNAIMNVNKKSANGGSQISGTEATSVVKCVVTATNKAEGGAA